MIWIVVPVKYVLYLRLKTTTFSYIHQKFKKPQIWIEYVFSICQKWNMTHLKFEIEYLSIYIFVTKHCGVFYQTTMIPLNHSTKSCIVCLLKSDFSHSNFMLYWLLWFDVLLKQHLITFEVSKNQYIYFIKIKIKYFAFIQV